MKVSDLFEALAATTWNTISRAHDRNIHCGEDAITTYNLLTLDSASIPCVFVEDARIDESWKGADWEFWIGSDYIGWTRYAVQAKKISPSRSSYNKLAHKVGTTLQLDILENYARANRAAPIYCFYNYVDAVVPWHCNLSPDPAQLGCSVAPSFVVRQALANRGGRSFGFVHAFRETLPWRCLVRCPHIIGRPSQGINPLVPREYSCRYPELPPALQRLRRSRSADILADSGDLFSRDTEFRPRWVGVVDLTDELNG